MYYLSDTLFLKVKKIEFSNVSMRLQITVPITRFNMKKTKVRYANW